MTPLFEDIALRSSEILGDFSTVFNLSHRYGDLTKTKIRLDKVTDKVYFVADHPMLSVDTIQESGQEITAWKAFTSTDKAGVTSTYIELKNTPDRDNALISASGKGKVSKLTGRLLENPAEIIQDIALINGREIQFPLFREECAKNDIRFAGSVNEIKSIRLYIKSILESVNALWLHNDASTFPTSFSYYDVIYNYTIPKYTATLEGQAGKIKIAYNFNEVLTQYSSFVSMRALGSSYQKERIIYAKWLKNNKDAIELANRLTRYYAGEHYIVETEVEGLRHVGDIILLNNSLFPIPFIVTEAVPESHSTKIKGILILSYWEAVKLETYTAELPISQNQSLELSFENGVLTITIFDESNKPFIGAFVSLDKSAPSKTNSKGQVSFSTKPGAHILDIASPGFTSINDLPITVQ